MGLLLLIVGLLLFIALVVVHEWGHFIMARRNGVEVEEFGIFFPPRLFSHKTKAGWLFTINLLPLGGFVKLKGEHDSDTAKGTFGAASLWAKSKIMAAGVVMNFIIAVVLFTILALIGMPKLLPHQYTVVKDTQLSSDKVLLSYVEKGSPADKAGLKVGDQITDVQMKGYSPVAIAHQDDLRPVTKKFAGKTAQVLYVRNGQEKEATVTFRSNGDDGYLGVVPTELTIQRSTWSAPIVAIGLTGQITGLTVQALGHALAGLGSLIAGAVTGNHTARENGQTAATSEVSGPVGIFAVLKDSSFLGAQFMLFIIANISLALAIMNILPIPALDGGRLWLTLAARAAKKPLGAKIEERVSLAGFAVLITLFVLITIVDVQRFF